MAFVGRTQIPLLTSLLAAGTLLSAAAPALAAPSGGSGLSGVPGTGSPAANPLVAKANVPESATADGITLETLATAQTARAIAFHGTVPTGDAGQKIELERESTAGPEPEWIPVAQATITATGTFIARWSTSQAGTVAVDAVLLGENVSESTATPATGAASVLGANAQATPPLTISVYQSAIATFYGPGFYGKQTACGEVLGRHTIGVANRTLPCGSSVSIMFRGREIMVPVIDRGPYANGADWDLTMATARALGMRTTGTIGALELPAA